MAELRVLPTLPLEVREDVIDLLEEALAEARAGRVRSVALALVRPNGGVSTWWSKTDCFAQMVGSATLLQNDIIANKQAFIEDGGA